MSNKATLVKVQGIKEALAKEVEKGDDLSVDNAKDMLEQLSECKMTMKILTTSLIGTVVSKLKKHNDMGPQAKALIKKWKTVAKDAAANKEAKKAERRASSNSNTNSEDVPLANADEWEDLSPLRKGVCQKLHKFLGVHKPRLVKSGINAEAVDHLLVSRASEIEAALYSKMSGSDYTDKARSLCFNMKKNADLSSSVILGQLPADQLIKMTSEELMSAEARLAREAESKRMSDSKRLDWDTANEDKINEMCGIKGDLLNASLFTCGRCKSVKTTSTQKQTRSADEPMTVFVVREKIFCWSKVDECSC